MGLIYATDLMGTFVFATSGLLAGMEKKIDLLGASVLGFATAVGGGTIRDLLIGQTPVGWMKDLNYLFAISLAVPVAYFFRHVLVKMRRSFFLFDAIGIGLFTILGLQKTLAAGLSPIIAILLGTVSATFGGVIRDVLSNEVPLIFRKEIYATACLLGGLIYLSLGYFSRDDGMNMVLSMLGVMVIRYLAVKNNWSLPAG